MIADARSSASMKWSESGYDGGSAFILYFNEM
jgi:hypothetical protein